MSKKKGDYDLGAIVDLAMLAGRLGHPLTPVNDGITHAYYVESSWDGPAADLTEYDIPGMIIKAEKEVDGLHIETRLAMLHEGISSIMPDVCGHGQKAGDIWVDLHPGGTYRGQPEQPYAQVDITISDWGALAVIRAEQDGWEGHPAKQQVTEIIGRLCVPHLMKPVVPPTYGANGSYGFISEEVMDPRQSLQVAMYIAELIDGSEVIQ